MKPWLIFNGIGLVLDLLNVGKAAFSFSLLNVAVNLAGWMLAAYLFLIVLSYNREVEADIGTGPEEGNCSPQNSR